MKKLLTTACLFVVSTIALVSFIAPFVSAQETKQSPTESGQAEREAMYYRYLEFASYVKGGSIEPHWMADGSSFWYAEGAPANTVIWKVDPKANTKTALFDTARLRKALTPLLGHEPPYQALPFETFTFVDGEKAVMFAVENKQFILQLNTYAIGLAPLLTEEERNRFTPKVVRKSQVWWSGGGNLMEVLSPDRRWFATLKDHNLWLRSVADGRSVPLTTHGIEDYEWGGHDVVGNAGNSAWAWWSPDTLKLAVKKVDWREVRKIPKVRWQGEEVDWVYGPRAGGRLPRPELFVISVSSRQLIRVQMGEEPEQYIHVSGWRPDGSELLFLRMNREYKKLDLMAVEATTGTTRIILTETQKTFLLGLPRLEWESRFTLLQDGKRFMWLSERDGWRHLYLYELDGTLIRRLTEGAFPVVRVVALEEKAGWVYFTAHGDPQRAYDTHLYRVNLEGTGFKRLTEATGTHDIQFAPSKEFFLDTHSSTDRPPATELRRGDGTLLQILSKANVDALIRELKWRPPEEFVVKAADGKTDLWGVLYKPYDFDPNKKYPVIERIYAGPQRTLVPHAFMPRGEHIQPQALAQLGFIVFVVDARGTPERGKEFQDVVYGNFGRHEIPDHVAALKQLAEKRRYMDLSRVGIRGSSWGGYFVLRAMLLAPDVYHVGVASGTSGDLEGGAVEPYMGLPGKNKEGYEYGSNSRLASKLKGKLLLIMGSDDTQFPDGLKDVDAFIQAGQRFDLLVLPGQGHSYTGTSGAYALEAIRRYFQEHLKP